MYIMTVRFESHGCRQALVLVPLVHTAVQLLRTALLEPSGDFVLCRCTYPVIHPPGTRCVQQPNGQPMMQQPTPSEPPELHLCSLTEEM